MRRRSAAPAVARMLGRAPPRCRTVGRMQVQQDADGGGLAGAVWAQEAEDLARPDVQVQSVEAAPLAVVLDQAAGGDGVGHRHHCAARAATVIGDERPRQDRCRWWSAAARMGSPRRSCWPRPAAACRLFEARETVGGGCRSAELTLPGVHPRRVQRRAPARPLFAALPPAGPGAPRAGVDRAAGADRPPPGRRVGRAAPPRHRRHHGDLLERRRRPHLRGLDRPAGARLGTDRGLPAGTDPPARHRPAPVRPGPLRPAGTGIRAHAGAPLPLAAGPRPGGRRSRALVPAADRADERQLRPGAAGERPRRRLADPARRLPAHRRCAGIGPARARRCRSRPAWRCRAWRSCRRIGPPCWT